MLWQKLAHLHKSASLPHALLIPGMRSSTKEHFIRDFSQFLLCQHPQETYCQRCSACGFFQENTHPDYCVLGENEAINVEKVRELTQLLANMPHQSNKRVIVLWGISELNTFASNALLKMVEEPPLGTFFLLETHKTARLLPTIRSRCMLIREFVLNEEERQNKEESDQLKKWLGVITCAEENLFYDQKLQKWLNEQTKNALYAWYEWLYQAILAKLTALPHEKNHLLVAEKSANLSLKSLLFFSDKIVAALKTLTEVGSINKSLLCESLFYEWKKITT